MALRAGRFPALYGQSMLCYQNADVSVVPNLVGGLEQGARQAHGDSQHNKGCHQRPACPTFRGDATWCTYAHPGAVVRVGVYVGTSMPL